jgi:hypothetical protein
MSSVLLDKENVAEIIPPARDKMWKNRGGNDMTTKGVGTG